MIHADGFDCILCAKAAVAANSLDEGEQKKKTKNKNKKKTKDDWALTPTAKYNVSPIDPK
jgi:hypothetical protein